MKSRKVRRNKCVIAIRLRSFDVQVAIRISMVSSDRKPKPIGLNKKRDLLFHTTEKSRRRTDLRQDLRAQSSKGFSFSPSVSSPSFLLVDSFLRQILSTWWQSGCLSSSLTCTAPKPGKDTASFLGVL